MRRKLCLLDINCFAAAYPYVALEVCCHQGERFPIVHEGRGADPGGGVVLGELAQLRHGGGVHPVQKVHAALKVAQQDVALQLQPRERTQ